MFAIIFYSIFSAMLLPVNFCCSFWLFQEMLNLSGMTFRECWQALIRKLPLGTRRKRKNGRRRKIILAYLAQRSSDKQKTEKLFCCYLCSTLPGLAALLLAEYTVISQNPDRLKFAFGGNLILVFVNLFLVFAGKIYRKNHPLDQKTAEHLAQTRERERESDRKHRVKNRIVYFIAAVFFLTLFIFFQLLFAAAFYRN